MKSDPIRRHTITVLLANGASMSFGLLATAAVAHYFGSGETVDALFIALSVPAMVGQVLLSISLLAVVPLYAQIRGQAGIAEAQRAVAPLFYGVVLTLLGCTVILVAASSVIVSFLAPGFSETATSAASELLRWASPLVFLTGLASLLQGIENANHRFVRPAWSKPLPTALALAFMALAAAPAGIKSYLWGSVAGAALGLGWQFSEVWKQGEFRPRLDGLRTVLQRLKGGIATIFTARILAQAGALVTAMVATTLGAGAVSSLGYAYRVVSIPFLAASSFGLVVFPALAQAAAENDTHREAQLYWRSVRSMMFLGVICSVGVFLWAGPLMQLLFERGAFTAEATLASASALRVYAVGIALVAANTCIGNAYWARKLYSLRLRMELVALLLLIGLSFTLAYIWGVSGLAAALVAEFAYLTVIGLREIQRRSPAPDFRAQIGSLGKLGVLGLGVTALLWPLVPDLADFRDLSFLARIATLAAGLLSSTLVLFTAGFFMAVPEIDEIIGRLLGRVTTRGKALDPEQVKVLPGRIRSKLRARALRVIPRRRPKPTHARHLREIAGSRADLLIRQFRSGPRPPGLYAGGIPVVSAEALDHAVDRALRREVDLLGSGPLNLGRPIQWHRDYVSGYEWPLVHHSRVVPVDLHNRADCKFPWEVARCQHWTHLASPHKNRARAAGEMMSQFREFSQANPPGWGVNYGNAMEVAVRSVNWLCSFRETEAQLSDEDLAHLAVELHASGEFMYSQLERIAPGLNTNHYIADLVGLYATGALLPALPDAKDWFRFSGDELTCELSHQFDADGVHCEGSSYYARLVLEFYLFAYLLGRRVEDHRVSAWGSHLEKAFAFLASALYPDGTLPRIGDDDAGRLLVPPGEPVMDARYLLQVGAVVFQRADWKAAAGSAPRPGLEYWLGDEGVERYRQLGSHVRPTFRKVFDASGLAVARTVAAMLVVQGGGSRGRSPRGHLHNDLTSFEYFADSVRWVLDPGSYQYTRLPEWRNRFRSTKAHNVVQVNGREQNRIRPDWLFYLSRDVEPRPTAAHGNEFVVGYEESQAGPKLSVTRQLHLAEAGRLLTLRDIVEGAGEVPLTVGINVAQASFTHRSRSLVHFQLSPAQLLVHFHLPLGFTLSVGEGWHSPRFGVRERCLRLEVAGTARLPFDLRWGLAAVPPGGSLDAWSALLLRSASDELPLQPPLARTMVQG